MFFIILFLAVAGVLFAVFLYKNDKGGNILVGASPDTTAFQLYYYDGETVMVRTLYDSSTEKEVIKRINDIPLQAAEEQALSQMETPFFGIWISSGEEFTYGEYFSLQKQIDGQWYTMPVRADNVGFQDIAHILPDGESASETYNLDIYGTLEPGMYRLVVETLSAEFLVGHGRMAGTCANFL